jgi:hypothetical protein
MKIVKYIAIRMILAVVFLFAMNILYLYTFWKEDINKHADTLENLWNVPIHSDAIYFGESSNFTMSENDSRELRISELVDEMLPSLSIATVDNAGLHAGTYLSLLKNKPSEMDLKFVIITMNYRSFGANWRYAPFENYLAKFEVMIEPGFLILNKFLISLKEYDFKSEEARSNEMKVAWRNEKFNIPEFEYNNVIEWDSAMAWKTWLNENPDLTEENIPLACHYIKNYAIAIDTVKNERIQDFNAIIELGKQEGFAVVLNLLSENTEEAQKLVGEELIYLMEKNRKLLVNYYTRRGVTVVDNFYSVSDSCFRDRDWPTEHYNFVGREIVAENIKKAIIENELHY